MLAAFGGFVACQAPDAGTTYDCRVSGEAFRYRDAQRIGPPGPDRLAFTLTTYAGQRTYRISPTPAIPEMSAAPVMLDARRSNPVESTYLRDTTDPGSKERVVTSLVLNTLSGDIRLFHHRWLPPAEWRDSDQYTYTGTCLREGGAPTA